MGREGRREGGKGVSGLDNYVVHGYSRFILGREGSH